MIRIPELWWLPLKGLLHRRPGESTFTRVLTGGEFQGTGHPHLGLCMWRS